MRNVAVVAALSLILTSACSGGKSPTRSWELAAQGVYSGALSSRGDLVIVGSLNHGASLWKTPEHERLYNWRHQAGEYVDLVAAGFSPDASRAITTDARTLVLWDTATGEALNYWGTPGSVLDVAMFSDNRHALLGLDDHSALVFDAQTGAYEQTLLHEGRVGAVDLSRQGTLALTGSDDNTAVLWRLDSGEAQHVFEHRSPVRAVALSATGEWSFTAAQGDLVAIWDNQSGRMMHKLHDGINHGVVSARFSDDGRYLAVGYASRHVRLYDVQSGQVVQNWDSGTRHAMRATGAAILEVAFREGGSAVIAMTGDGRLLELTT